MCKSYFDFDHWSGDFNMLVKAVESTKVFRSCVWFYHFILEDVNERCIYWIVLWSKIFTFIAFTAIFLCRAARNTVQKTCAGCTSVHVDTSGSWQQGAPAYYIYVHVHVHVVHRYIRLVTASCTNVHVHVWKLKMRFELENVLVLAQNVTSVWRSCKKLRHHSQRSFRIATRDFQIFPRRLRFLSIILNSIETCLMYAFSARLTVKIV